MRSIKNLDEPCWVIKNMSFLISSATRFLLNSGEICKAFTLKESRTSMMFSKFPSAFALMMRFLCSWRTFSENNYYFSSLLSSVKRILWYFPRSTLYASIASPRLSVLAWPSLSEWRCWRQLTDIVKICLAESNYESCFICKSFNSLLNLAWRPSKTDSSS